jgi:phosphonate transport system permease protein
LILPLLGIGVGYAFAGGIFGDSGLLWGGLGGLIAVAVLWWAGICRIPVLSGLLVAASVAGLGLFDWSLGRRSGPIDLAFSLEAALGWAVVGIAFGIIVRQARPGILGRSTLVISASGWALGGVTALMFGTGIGYIDELRTAAIEAGEIEALGTSFFVWVGLLAAVIGASVGLSLYVGTPLLIAGTASATFTVFALGKIDFSFAELITRLGNLGEIATDLWPPVWTWPRTVGGEPANQLIEPMIETLQIAIIGATLGCILALPLAFVASRPTTYNTPTFWGARAFMNVIRTIPDLFWAALFAAGVGFGAFAGALAMIMFSLAIMAKLLSETIDSVDPGPLEAARAAGSRHSQMVQYSAMPQVLPNYVAYAFYIFELNIRASVVIGIVGGGGIGRLLDEQRSFFQWDRVMAIVIIIFVAVILIESVSVWARRKIV